MKHLISHIDSQPHLINTNTAQSEHKPSQILNIQSYAYKKKSRKVTIQVEKHTPINLNFLKTNLGFSLSHNRSLFGRACYSPPVLRCLPLEFRICDWLSLFNFIAQFFSSSCFHTKIVGQNLFDSKPALGNLGARNERWPLSLCRTGCLCRWKAWSGKGCFIWSARDGHWEMQRAVLVRNHTKFGYRWELMIRMLCEIVHVKQIINTCNDIEG